MFRKNGGNMSIELVIGVVAFVMFVATVLVYLKKDDTEAKAFADAHKSLLTQVEGINKKLDQIQTQASKLASDIEAAHSQADSAKSKAEAADYLANKVAVDLAKRPATQIQPGPIKVEPIKVEPIRVIVYRKSDLKKSTETVKAPQQEKTLKQ